jgi:hypothetical protein
MIAWQEGNTLFPFRGCAVPQSLYFALTQSTNNVYLTVPLWLWQILDADFGKRLESSTGRIATRDIVQFVPVQEVEGQHLHL